MDKKGLLLAQGNTAEIYEWETDKILKLYRKGLPEALCNDEFYVTKSVYDLLKITPEPFEIVHINGRVGAVYERINGKTMLKEMMSKPWRISKYSRLLAQYHKNIQRPIDFNLPTVKEKLKRDIDAVTLLSDIEKQHVCQYMTALPDGNILCHFDFHPDNIMFTDGNPIIIDWMTACKGDGLSDVARTCVILSFSEIPRVPGFVNLILGHFMKRMNTGYLKEYLKIAGVQMDAIKAWEMPIAAARLREWIPEKEKQNLLAFVRRTLSKEF